ncbi:LytR family transcriptional regulator [Paenibacillus baekrokdamisoli]|uniref:LytR family transcriptional regulator n=1 Tax=Paenibacillus baekrokdamisoli TaxID=1712516 RepID=A0A3G9ISM4_9BACL|nr:LCP family protein [Paenibacillus baekrokdamisoli]MBB3071663.1 LCP family protein required for cell wall assembly [Paenibacillus baekrokdamisoli]BBH21827.1 LytR family transcriptional regulator [Paenibacillus baekrokdamisoli]
MKFPLRKILIWSGSIGFVILLFVGGYLWYLFHSVKVTADRIYEDIPHSDYISVDPSLSRSKDIVKLKSESNSNPDTDKRNPFTVLMLGVDQRKNDHGRSDTIIVLSVNPKHKSILMFNILRDSRTEIVGHGTVDKINHAYAFGNVEMSLHTVEKFLDYPIDYYIKVNMEGFERIINLFGGVEVNNPLSFQYEGVNFEKGHLTLDGTEALLFSRMRYDDPRGDIGRNARQREVLSQVMKKAMKISSITRINTLLNEIGDSVKTNIKYEEMKTFVMDYRADLNNMESIEIKGKGQIINKVWYYIVDDAERGRIHNVLKEHQADQ